MPPTGDEPIGASIEVSPSRSRVTARSQRRRRGLVEHYPGVEEASIAASPGAWAAGRKFGFIVASAAVGWGAIFGLISLLR